MSHLATHLPLPPVSSLLLPAAPFGAGWLQRLHRLQPFRQLSPAALRATDAVPLSGAGLTLPCGCSAMPKLWCAEAIANTAWPTSPDSIAAIAAIAADSYRRARADGDGIPAVAAATTD